MKLKNTIIISVLIAVVLVFVDQITKYLAFKNFNQGVVYNVIPHIIDYILLTNDGAVWGIFDGMQVLFLIVTIIGLGLFSYMFKYGDYKKYPFYTIGLVMMVSGTIGNFIDRLIFSEVRDFLTFAFFDFPSFNVADMCMCVGIVMLAIDIIFGGVGDKWK